LIIASFVTIAELLMKAYLPPVINESLGIFIPLIVVNCVILYRAEDFASKNNIFYSAIDGAGMGIGFTLALIIVSAIREILGEGTIFGIKMAVSYQPAVIFIMAPGAFLTLGLLLALFNWQRLRKKERL
jgi:electron transport complex protein RnfE